MKPDLAGKRFGGRRRERGMTILETLLVVTIIASLLAVVTPALLAGRGEAKTATCLNNLREIVRTAGVYSENYTPGCKSNRLELPWYLDTAHYPNVAWVTQFIYGGYRTTTDHPLFSSSDVYIVPTEARPFNKYLAPGAGGRSPIKPYVCPADTWTYPANLQDPGCVPTPNTDYGSWEISGNSYALNWHWVQGTPNPDFDLPTMHARGSAMLARKVGGAAGEFVVFMESLMSDYMYDARPPDGSHGQSVQEESGFGWHGRYSTYNMAMWDGHVESRFIDPRYSSGQGYDLWPELDTPWPQPGFP